MGRVDRERERENAENREQEYRRGAAERERTKYVRALTDAFCVRTADFSSVEPFRIPCPSRNSYGKCIGPHGKRNTDPLYDRKCGDCVLRGQAA